MKGTTAVNCQFDYNQFVTVERRSVEIDDINLEYSLLEIRNMLSGEHIYSLKVSVTQEDSTEFKLAFDISRDLSRAKELFEILHRNTVTPCTLYDVLEDIL